ncbi:hypothetical protein PR048_023095 [Dryococelus australis]|uniref:Uncharacterized protein n=1 Tax=Dryococelus australis TaxID=614101 RepID=A0ABQ9GT44_9NEOP|nr:hypothetical protein PR048_023095 [Dryococelus australis]
MSGSDLSQHIARMLLTQYVTPAAAIGASPNTSRQSTPRSCRGGEAKARGQHGSSCTSEVLTTVPSLCEKHGIRTKMGVKHYC